MIREKELLKLVFDYIEKYSEMKEYILVSKDRWLKIKQRFLK